MSRTEEWKEITRLCKDKYEGARDLLASVVIESDKWSIVVYQLGQSRTRYMVCQGDKRVECGMDEVLKEIDKLR